MLKVKAVETKMQVGIHMGAFRFVLRPEMYSTLTEKKVVEEAAIRSGVSRGVMQAAWDALAAVLQAWATEGHSVAVPGLGTMRFGIKGSSVANVNDVQTSLITTRKVIFTPSVDIKQALKATAVAITCYDRNGNVIKRVSSGSGDIEGEGDYTVSLSCNPDHGTVTGAGNYAAGASATIKATPKSGYTFEKWSDGDTHATRSIVVNEDITLVATFKAAAAGGEGGGQTPGGSQGGGNVSGGEDALE